MKTIGLIGGRHGGDHSPARSGHNSFSGDAARLFLVEICDEFRGKDLRERRDEQDGSVFITRHGSGGDVVPHLAYGKIVPPLY